MQENRFSGIKFGQGMLKSGAKVSGGADASIRITSTYNNFVLSAKALTMLGVTKGDYVQIYDMAGVPGANVDNHYKNRFYVSKGFKWNGVQQGAKLGDNGQFTFNVGWGAIMAQDLEIKEITGDQLVDREMAILREVKLKKGGTQKTYISLKKAVSVLTPVNVDEEGVNQPVEVIGATDDTPAIEVVMYSLSDIRFSDHKPKIGSDGAVEEEEEEVEEVEEES